MSLSSSTTSVGLNQVAGFHIYDAGTPPPLLATSLWMLISFAVTFLFVELRPAILHRVRALALTDVAYSQGAFGIHVQGRLIWRVLTAICCCALFDVVHRTCCYLMLSPHMLDRRHLLPLGSTFLIDGIWTEWVNWVRLYLFCRSALSDMVNADLRSCSDWLLPFPGVLAYTQHVDNVAVHQIPATPSEVLLYRKVCFAALFITWMAVIALRCQYRSLCHIFFAPKCVTAAHYAHSSPSEGSATDAGNGAARTAAAGISGDSWADAPGDDSWVDSPEALAEEERWCHRSGDVSSAGVNPSLRDERHAFSPSAFPVVQECWPSLVSSSYAALFSVVGGMPLFMTYLFPAALALVSLWAVGAPA